MLVLYCDEDTIMSEKKPVSFPSTVSSQFTETREGLALLIREIHSFKVIHFKYCVLSRVNRKRVKYQNFMKRCLETPRRFMLFLDCLSFSVSHPRAQSLKFLKITHVVFQALKLLKQAKLQYRF